MTGEEEERRLEHKWPLEFLLIIGLILLIYVFGSFAWGECQP